MTDFHHYARLHEALFEEKGKKSSYKKGQLLMHRDEESPWIFFVHSGYVKLAFTNDGADERVLGFAVPGMPLAQGGSFHSLPHLNLEYEAHTDCVVSRMAMKEFMQELSSDTDLFMEWHNRILQNHTMFIERILYSGERDPKVRVMGWLLGMDRYYSNTRSDGKRAVEIPMTQDIIAGFTHLSRESVNKILQELKQQGLIEINNKIIIMPDPNKIRGFL